MKVGKHTIELLKRKLFKKAVVHFIIDNEWSQNRDRFKPGDQVRFNWRAKAFILSAIKDDINKTFVVSKILYSDQSGVEFTNGDGCDPFWLRKARKSELISPQSEGGQNDKAD